MAELATEQAAILVLAEHLVDEIERVVLKHATRDWCQSGVLDQTARTWPSEVCDLSNYGLDERNTSPVKIRSIIMRAATACIEEPNER